jgi:hypothetical protein
LRIRWRRWTWLSPRRPAPSRLRRPALSKGEPSAAVKVSARARR